MKRIGIGLGILLSLTASAAVQVGADLGYTHVAGVRRYTRPLTSLNQTTDRVLASSVQVTLEVCSRIDASLRYTHYDALRIEGVSGTSDIFGKGVVALQVITPFSVREKIQETTFGLNYRLIERGPMTIGIGPELALFYSRATVAAGSRWAETFSEVDLRLGGQAQVRYAFDERWSIQVGLRLVKPPSRTLTVVHAGLGYRF
jgi:hypothetical protein